MTQTNIITSFKKDISAIARTLERKRTAYLMWLLLGIGVASFFMTFMILFINPGGADVRYTVTCGALLPSILIYTLLSRSYMKKAEASFLGALEKATGFRHRDDGCFAVDAMEKHKILPVHNRSRLETGLQGKYQGVPIDVQEVVLTTLQQDPEHKNRSKEYLRFWGLLVRVQLARPVEGHTIALPRTAWKTFFPKEFSDYEIIKIPEGRFTTMFEVKATDNIEAKFIMTNFFKERFIEAGRTLKIYWSEASFKGNEALFAFQRFRPLIKIDPLWKPIEESTLRRNAEELESIVRIVDALKANNQLSL